MMKLKAVHVVYADWCPHCVPMTVEPVKRKAQQIGIPCVLYHVDEPDASKKADILVKTYGDWCEDYLIPQVFLEFENSEFKHVFTGYSEDIELTRRNLENMLKARMIEAR